MPAGAARVHEAKPKGVAACLTVLNPRRLYHRAEILFPENIPQTGGAVLVCNHGRLDFDCFILVSIILKSRGRLARVMADHLWFTLPGVRQLWARAGAVDGTRQNALQLLEKGELVLTYPGGVREIMGSRFGREDVDWRGRTGFAQVALAAQVPLIPVLGVGVNSGHLFVSSGRLLGTWLFQKVLRLGPAYKDYRDPLTIGLIPLPLPFSLAVHAPWPCKLRYVVGDAICSEAARAGERRLSTDASPADGAADGAVDRAAELAARVEAAMRTLIAQYGS